MTSTSDTCAPIPVPLEGSTLQQLYQEQFSPIYRYIYSKVGQREVAADLTSQVFLKAVRDLHGLHSLASMRRWLFAVARTTVADYWRAWYRVPTSSLEALVSTGWEGPAVEEPLGSEGEPAEQVARLLQALPERHREILTCRFLLALSIRETATRMGLTEQNVKVLQLRALKRAAAFKSLLDEAVIRR